MVSPQQHFEASRKWQEHYQKEVEDIRSQYPTADVRPVHKRLSAGNDEVIEENLYSTDS
jgi:hypothetical protein